ncbi:MAG: YceI family protein [Bacteroidota bacterium]|nr:YceI family protein [Bacteroidota bacterium]
MAKWLVDPTHSEVHFKIKHLVISTVTGSFKKFSGTLEADKGDFSDAKVNFTIDATSIDTNNEQRDGHLKSEEFFDAEKYPELKFVSTSVSKQSDDEFLLTGDLTIRDVTKPVELNVEYGGETKDLYGQNKIGFDVSGKINRQDYGLKWSAVTEAGGLVVSNDVKLLISVQFIKQPD